MALNLKALSDHVCSVRNLQYLVQGKLFGELYASANRFDQTLVERIVANWDEVGVRRWMNQQQHWQQDYDDMSVRALRRLGKIRRVLDYNKLTKNQLVAEMEAFDAGKDKN